MRRSLFQKYFGALLIGATLPLLASGVIDAWFAYRDQRATLDLLLQTYAISAAARIEKFLEGRRDDLYWALQRDWGAENGDEHRLDVLRVLRQTSAIVSIALIDQTGTERLFVSRVDLDRRSGGVDRSHDPAVAGARDSGTWFGPVTYYQGSEPFMVIAVASRRKAAGIAVAEINLKLIWDTVAAIHAGRSGRAIVFDQLGRLVAHPDIAKVLSGRNDEQAKIRRKLRDAIDDAAGRAITTVNADGEAVIAAAAGIPGPGWTVLVEQPRSEAFDPIYGALRRTGILLLGAVLLTAVLALWLAGRMTGPVRLLEEGVMKFGAGEFEHRIVISTGDELERLAKRFNDMADELATSRGREERLARLRRFLAPQVAELVEKAGDDSVLLGQRALVSVVFCDLRGFTAFAAEAEPEEVMQLLAEYYRSLGAIVTRFEATVTSLSADGLMVLVNAPVPCQKPALRAVEIALAMQQEVQHLLGQWRRKGHAVGFGVGLSLGWATVGRVGYEGRQDYTAIGSVVNLAARLCASAEDRQILVDAAIAQAVSGEIALNALGARHFKGFGRELIVYSVSEGELSREIQF
jgi:class 3 adenylate cyclase